ncbi:5-oxoprolinase (ATP-hydrolyzing) (fragment) [uncultured Desulfobacterium sp.]|uniref:5-oxoprolinase (ATP-hydrolyzing) n=1 Tax=uncultured Desulfobacterium sp. TaxID=201089 RepID=A0A445MVT1_9BACT
MRCPFYFNSAAAQAGISSQELAEGILDVVNSAMERAIRVISVERGHDPAEFTLLAFGGAGAMHAAFLAAQMNIPRVLIPINPGLLSAMGMLMADVIKDYSITVMMSQRDTAYLTKQFDSLEERGVRDMASEGISKDKVYCERYLDMRYQGQSYEIMAPYSKDFIAGFHSLHEKTYGYKNKDRTVEIVNLRLRARAVPDRPQLEKIEATHDPSPEQALISEHDVIFEHKKMKTRILDREMLKAGNRIDGPAIVTEYSSTTVIPPFAWARVDEYGNIVITFRR